jgi:hypothetical protein
METILKFVIRPNFEIRIAEWVSPAVTCLEVGPDRLRAPPSLQPNTYTRTSSSGGGRSVKLTTHLTVSRVRMRGALPSYHASSRRGA